MFSELSEQFSELGYLEPLPILSTLERQSFLETIADPKHPPPLDWNKGQAVTSRRFFEIGSQPAIVDRVSALLGEDVMLWGASMQDRTPGAIHPWHSDIECSKLPKKTITVWLGLENTNSESSLSIISHSHSFGVTVQEVRHELGKARDEVTDEEILDWARGRDERSNLIKLDMSDGDAVILDGQLWHGSRNLFSETRRALLLQYATPDAAIRIPDLNYLDWPFRQFSLPKPACLMVKGSATTNINRIVPPPVPSSNGNGSTNLTSQVCPVQLPLDLPETEGWKPYFLFHGSTSELSHLSCHVSVLKKGHCPHCPHKHDEEELLMVLRGEVHLTLPEAEGGEESRERSLTAGEFVYYPIDFPHTLTGVSEEPANYLMFKWQNPSRSVGSHLTFGQFNLFESSNGSEIEPGFNAQLVFEGSSPYLRKLHCHKSTLIPGAGYEPHIDSHDVGIVVLEGEVELLGKRVGPHGVVFCPAGEPHGIRNPGEVEARYVVFEFHGQKGDELNALQSAQPAECVETPRARRTLKDLLTALIKKV